MMCHCLESVGPGVRLPVVDLSSSVLGKETWVSCSLTPVFLFVEWDNNGDYFFRVFNRQIDKYVKMSRTVYKKGISNILSIIIMDVAAIVNAITIVIYIFHNLAVLP